VENYKNKPFVLLSVNSDSDLELARSVHAKEGLSWRTFWCGAMGARGPIPKTWGIRSWPTMVLIDDQGIIRKRTTLLEADAWIREIDPLLAILEKRRQTR
jgi:hypothetical protein